jgi:hypothetical protein
LYNFEAFLATFRSDIGSLAGHPNFKAILAFYYLDERMEPTT